MKYLKVHEVPKGPRGTYDWSSPLHQVERWTLDEVLLKKAKLHQLSFKYTWVHVWVHWSELARRGELEHELWCTWDETARGALCRQVLQSRACEAEENLSAKCTECSFNPNVPNFYNYFLTNASSKQIQLNFQLWGKDFFLTNPAAIWKNPA